jgi:hypothetical protein
MVSLYHVLVSTYIFITSPLFTVQVSPTLLPLIIRYPDAVLGYKINVPVTETLSTPAVYILDVYQVFSCVEPLDAKIIPSGVVSRIANISAIYLLASYCNGI